MHAQPPRKDGAYAKRPTHSPATHSFSDNTEQGLPIPQRYWAMLVIALALTLAVLDSAIANVALPTIARNLHASAAGSIWVVNAYQLGDHHLAAAARLARRPHRLPAYLSRPG